MEQKSYSKIVSLQLGLSRGDREVRLIMGLRCPGFVATPLLSLALSPRFYFWTWSPGGTLLSTGHRQASRKRKHLNDQREETEKHRFYFFRVGASKPGGSRRSRSLQVTRLDPVVKLPYQSVNTLLFQTPTQYLIHFRVCTPLKLDKETIKNVFKQFRSVFHYPLWPGCGPRPRPIFPMSLSRKAVHQGTFQLWLNGTGRS